MPKDNISRKFHLQNVQEWLTLAGTPIRKAQEASAIALKEHWEMHNSAAMMSMTDVAGAVNTALAWIMYSQDTIRDLLQEIDEPSEETPEPEDSTKFTHYCDECGRRFVKLSSVGRGEACPFCGKGTILPINSEPEVESGVYLRCTSCGVLQPVKDNFIPGDLCPVCRSGSLLDNLPF